MVEACGERFPKVRVSGRLVHAAMTAWQRLHFRFGLPQPPLEPLAVERVYLDNYFSIEKARRDLGYEPLFTTEQALQDCRRTTPICMTRDEERRQSAGPRLTRASAT